MYKIRANVTKTIIEFCDVKIVDSIGKTYIKKNILCSGQTTKREGGG